MDPILHIDHLTVRFRRQGTVTTPVRDLAFAMAAGERLALVGESGCGKSMTVLALTGLSPTDLAERRGEAFFCGQNLLALSAEEVRHLRGKNGISYIFQDPTGSLNPVMRIGDQIAECLEGAWKMRVEEATHLLARVGLPDPARAFQAYPCELSGGMQQRAMIAMALAAKPKLLIADEPTTALDVTTQRQVLDLIDRLVRETGLSLLLITHNLGLVAGRVDRVAVMYAGQIVEIGPVADVLRAPQHPYTVGLLAAMPRVRGANRQPLVDIPGSVPSPDRWPGGCAFAPRCPKRALKCQQPPLLEDSGSGRQARCWMLPKV